MSKCAWCNRPVSGGMPDSDSPDFFEWVANHHSRMCAALWEAQSDNVPPAVSEAAKILYWWVQHKVAHNPNALVMLKRIIKMPPEA